MINALSQVKIVYSHDALRDDDLAYDLAEFNQLTSDYKQLRRWQVITASRRVNTIDYEIAQFWKDMGPANSWKNCGPIHIVGGTVEPNSHGGYDVHMDETVGRLKEMADNLRYRPAFDVRELAENNNIRTEY